MSCHQLRHTMATQMLNADAALADGQSLKHIAAWLCISPKTVGNHRTSIMRKLDLHSTVELIRYAARVGVIDLDLWKE